MTEIEQNALESFNERVSYNGKLFAVGDVSVLGLSNMTEPENATYSLEDGEGQDAIVKVLRSEWPDGSERKGTFFDQAKGGLSFRIKSARKDTLFWHFRCTVT